MRQNALDGFDGRPGFHLDRTFDHVVVGILGHLARHEDEIAGAHGGMERQVRVLLADRIDVRALGFGHVVHGQARLRKCAGFDDVDAVHAIDQINQAASVGGDVIR